MLRGWTMNRLSILYEQYKEPQKAQRMRERLAKKYPRGFPADMGVPTAGQIYRASDRRRIEEQIRKREAARKPETVNVGSPDYWIKRGEHHSRRREDGQYTSEPRNDKEAVAAFEKAMTLAPDSAPPDVRRRVIGAYTEYWIRRGDEESQQRPDARVIEAYDRAMALAILVPDSEGDYRQNPRAHVIMAYLRHFARQGGKMVFDHAHKRLESEALPGSPRSLAEMLINVVLASSEKYADGKESGRLAYDDPLLWGHLAALPDWGIESGQQSLNRTILERLIRAAPEEKREAQWIRAEAMIQGDSFQQRLMLADAIRYGAGWKQALLFYHSLVERTKGTSWYGIGMDELWLAYAATEDLEGLVSVDAARRYRTVPRRYRVTKGR
jgi:hypothetical protein